MLQYLGVMKLEVPKSTLDKALKAVCRAVPNKGIQPILNNILLENNNGHLVLNATDLDFYIEATIPSNNIDSGRITLSAKKLEEIVGKLEDDDILIDVNEKTNEAKLTCNSAHFDLIGVSAEDFPEFSKPNAGDFFTVNASKLSKAISLVSFAASRFDVNNILGGVYMQVNAGSLELAATDGNRLSSFVLELEDAGALDGKEVVVPVKVIEELQRIIENSVDESVQVAFLDNQVVFKTEDRFVVSRLLDGTYPKYKQLIPENSDKTAQIDRKKFLSCLERVAVMANERTNLVKLSFEENQLAIESSNLDMGGADEKIEIDFMGEPLDIFFNVKYLAEAIKTIDADKIQIAMTKSLSPAVIKPLSEGKYIYLIMPVKSKQ